MFIKCCASRGLWSGEDCAVKANVTAHFKQKQWGRESERDLVEFGFLDAFDPTFENNFFVGSGIKQMSNKNLFKIFL